jgi:epoxyqueuosine reductase
MGFVDKAAAAVEIAREVGFDLAGIAPLRPPRDAERFDSWIRQGRHADMGWIERLRDRIVDPRRIAPESRSLLVVGLAHARNAVELHGGGRIARYAAGRDYHNVMGRLLRKLSRRLSAAGIGRPGKRIVDAGPLMERSHAAEAGLGFESKAANLLHPSFGPWFFLAELLLDEELEPTTAPSPGTCGTCTACLDACPTGAIVAPGEVDARTCISYQTIENRGTVPPELRPKIGEWAFGCDVCSEVCPWGARSADFAGRLGTHAAVSSLGLVEWIDLKGSLGHRLEGSALRRPGRAGLVRNAVMVLGARPSDEGRRALLRALTFDPSAMVRETAAWSLARSHPRDAGTREALDAAATREVEPTARRAILDWRASCG